MLFSRTNRALAPAEPGKNRSHLSLPISAPILFGQAPSPGVSEGDIFTGAHGAASRGGFSLIEVAIAIGIVAFAVLALVGTLGVGTTTLGSAVSYSIQTQITQNVMGSLKLSDFSVLTNNSPAGWNGAQLFFDERGVSTTNPSQYIYTATVNITTPVTLSGTTIENTNLALASLSIVKNSNTNDACRVVTYIANNGH